MAIRLRMSISICDSLKADASYEYQVGSGDSWSQTAVFHGGAAENAGQKFFLLGDIQAEDRTNITNIFNKLKLVNMILAFRPVMR